MRRVDASLVVGDRVAQGRLPVVDALEVTACHVEVELPAGGELVDVVGPFEELAKHAGWEDMPEYDTPEKS